MLPLHLLPDLLHSLLLSKACLDVGGESYKPRLTLLVVSKSHGLRMLAVNTPSPNSARSKGAGGIDPEAVDNPPPGAVLDHTVTR